MVLTNLLYEGDNDSELPFPISESAVKLNSASITFVKPAGYTYLFGFGKHCVKLDAIIKNSGDATGSTM